MLFWFVLSLESLPSLHQQLLRNETWGTCLSQALFGDNTRYLGSGNNTKGKNKTNSLNRKLDVVSWRGILFALFLSSNEKTREKYHHGKLSCLLRNCFKHRPWCQLMIHTQERLKDSSHHKIMIIPPLFHCGTRTSASHSTCQHSRWKQKWASTGWGSLTQLSWRFVLRSLAWRWPPAQTFT